MTIYAGDLTANYTAPPQGDDVFVDGAPFTLSVTNATVPGHTFEDLVISPASATIEVTDTIDPVTVGIVSNGDVNEASEASFTVTVSQALDYDLDVTLSNGDAVTIDRGHLTTNYTMPPQGDDVYVDGDSVTLSVTGAQVAGQIFEDLAFSPESATVGIFDTIDPTYVSITGPGTVVEGDTTANYTVSVDHPTMANLTVNLTYSGVAQDGTDFTGVGGGDDSGRR